MQKQGIDLYIMENNDPHESEYLPDHWKEIEWLSGFRGEVATVLVTQEEALLWTDSRFFISGEQQLADSPFKLMKMKVAGVPTVAQWLDDYKAQHDTNCTGGDSRILFGNEVDIDVNLISQIWEDRPSLPMNKIEIYPEALSGEKTADRISRVLDAVEEQGSKSLWLSALDEIAWLLNLRGSDVEFTPVAIAFFYLSNKDRVIFIDEAKVTSEVRDHLKSYKVRIKNYDDVEKFLEKRNVNDTILLDPNKVSDTLGQALMCDKVYGASPVAALKAIKNEVQIEGFRHAMERDGAALVRLFMWIEQNAATGTINEVDVWERGKLERAKSDLYRGDSFEMIAGYREHGAIVHYTASAESANTLQGEGLLLVDSGAQYLDGTTDITRTVTLGTPTAQEKHDFTLVLKGHLALSRAKFPVGTTGVQLDAFARMPLWQEAMTFLHGTGHGLGHFLGCHEGPHSIRTNLNPVALEPGMVTSNEPGLYKAGEYGIRTENILLVVEGPKTKDFGDFLEFETLTLFPYDTRLIDLSMLTPEEVKQINDYHAMVLARLTPYLNEQEVTWLQIKCSSI